MTDFWPADIGLVPEGRTPATILKEAAADLSRKTKQILNCEVRTEIEGQSLLHTLVIVAPAVNNYQYDAVYARHFMTLYPVSIWGGNIGSDECPDEAVFISELKKRLAAAELRKVISALILQSTQ